MYDYDLYQDAIDFYYKRTNQSEEYVNTASLGTVILALNESLKQPGSSNIKRCKECYRFFVSNEKHIKYCDSAKKGYKTNQLPVVISQKRKSRNHGIY